MMDAALQAVANEVERIVNPPPTDNVVPMRTQHGPGLSSPGGYKLGSALFYAQVQSCA